MYPAGTKVGLVIQAFRNLGKENIDNIAQARTRFFSGTSKNELIKNLKYSLQWIRVLIFKIMDVII